MIGPTPAAILAIATVDQHLAGTKHHTPTIVTVCCAENHPVDITVVPAEWGIWRASPNQSLERDLPSTPKADRELFLSGICGRCWTHWFCSDDDGPNQDPNSLIPGWFLSPDRNDDQQSNVRDALTGHCSRGA